MEEEYKICIGCNINKSLNEFGRDKKRKDGKNYRCKLCVAKYSKNSYIKSKLPKENTIEKINPTEKICTVCKEVKLLTEFNNQRLGKYGKNAACQKCTRQKYQDFRLANLDRRKEREKKAWQSEEWKSWQKKYLEDPKNKDKRNIRKVEWKHKLKGGTYLQMLESQNYCCYICGKHESEFTKRLSLDHNHSTGTIRCILCHACNTGIGMFKEDTEIMKKAIDYLIIHNNE